MKRLRSSGDEMHSNGKRDLSKDWGKRDEESSSHRNSSFYYKSSENGRKSFTSSTSRHDHLEEEKESSRMFMRRSDYDIESYDRRKGNLCSSPRTGYGGNHMYRSQSFSGSRRDFPKGFRSERDRSKKEVISGSWRRFGAGKGGDDGSFVSAKEIAKSPVCSKDSGSDASKSVDEKKCEDMVIESSGTGSEREEGELDPDYQPHVTLTKLVNDDEDAMKSSENGMMLQDKASNLSIEKENGNLSGGSEDRTENGRLEDDEGIMDENGCPETVGGVMKDSFNRDNDPCDNVIEESMKISDNAPSLPERRDNEGIQGQVRDDDPQFSETKPEKIGSPELSSIENKADQNLNDKGKGIALAPSECVQISETNMELENKLKDNQIRGDIENEGPSSRGFQFFSNEPIKKIETVEELANFKDDKLALELSLSLPNVLLPIGSQNRVTAPDSPSQTRSIHSFNSTCRTFSDGFTASMSFSGTQQFSHNPSCSLTNNMNDNEQSVKSKPLFKGVDWKALSSDENKNKDFQAYKSEENDPHHQSNLFNGETTAQHPKTSGEGFKQQIVFDCKFDSQKSNDRKVEVLMAGFDSAESFVSMIVSDPIRIISQKFNDMTAEQLASVKEFIHEIISNPVKQWKLSALQNKLLKRQDVSLDMLLNANRSQLEILVALKTGLREYILKKSEIPSSELAEIFVNMRCKNLTCKSLLPVDECDCKICTKRSDFCRECMCLVCSKFDNAANTCSWVGCDVCLHWCHADCGLRESHIRIGHNAKGALGTTKVQFYCVACGHPSEMFGFVKEVFQSFVNEWTAENLSRELEFVRRIFSASEDVRGKHLHELAVQMKSRIASRSDLRDVRSMIMNFFTEANSGEPSIVAVEPVNEFTKIRENAGSSQGNGWLKPLYQDKTLNMESSVNSLSGFDRKFRNGHAVNVEDIKKNAHKEPAAFDELESIVRIKLAEANMFQARADEARRESEALKRISVSKNERIEEEYTMRINRLRLSEAEEMRKQKIEELQCHERTYQEYFNMKMRMETDIKDLLLKMEAKRRNLVHL